MIIDRQNRMAENQVLGNTGTIVCTDIIDLLATGTIPGPGGKPISDPGRGKAKELLIRITETATSGGASTTNFQLAMSDNNDLSSPTVLQETDPIAKATLVAGYRVPLTKLPVGITKRFLGVQWVNATANYTAGKVTIALVECADNNML